MSGEATHSGMGRGAWFSVLGVACAFVVSLLLTLFPFHVRHKLEAHAIGHLDGYGYAAMLARPPGWPLLTYQGDDYQFRRSALTLHENGTPLDKPHAPQIAIQTLGGGRYLHLRSSELYFSASDNSDPRHNKRTYEIQAPVKPRPGLTFGLFVGVIASAAGILAARTTGRRISLREDRRIGWLIGAAFILLSATWLQLIWQPAPLIIDTGDGGNVASIAAARLYPDRFANDPVFSSAAHFSFYAALIVPLTMMAARWIGDVGQGYAVLIFPIILIQAFGFYRLGRLLYGGRGWAFALALLSIPPVYVFGGELWGLLSMPLTRAIFGAVLPYLLICTFKGAAGSTWHIYAAMAGCGIGVYLHPVSAPSVALACWLAILACKPDDRGWLAHLLRLIPPGVMFVLMALPFALMFFNAFPGASPAQNDTAQALRLAAGPRYFDVAMIVREALDNGWGWRWLVWLASIVGLWWVPKQVPHARVACRCLTALLLGVLLASIGITWLDQTQAAFRSGRLPYQIDLVRNVRFVVPLLLISAVWLLTTYYRTATRSVHRGAAVALTIALVLTWWGRHPTPISSLVSKWIFVETPQFSITPEDRKILRHIAALPPHHRVLALPNDGSEDSVELVGLAIRYAALHPVALLRKDLNFLSYSGNGRINDWMRGQAALERAGSLDANSAAAVLAQIVEHEQVGYLLMHENSIAPALLDGARTKGYPPVARTGAWRLFSTSKR